MVKTSKSTKAVQINPKCCLYCTSNAQYSKTFRREEVTNFTFKGAKACQWCTTLKETFLYLINPSKVHGSTLRVHVVLLLYGTNM